MSRQLTPVQVEILSESFQESYWTLTAVFSDAGVVASVAGTQLTIDGHLFDAGLMTVSGLKSSLGSSVDRIDVTVQNVDWRWTRIAQTTTTKPVRCEISRVMRNVRGGAWVELKLLSGIVVAIPSDEQRATVQCISDLYAAPSVGALRQVARPCQWKFRDPRTCGYDGTETVCNKIFESADGCAGRNNQAKYGGFTYSVGKDTLYIPAPDPSGNPTPGGGGQGGDGNIYHKYENDYLLSY